MNTAKPTLVSLLAVGLLASVVAHCSDPASSRDGAGGQTDGSNGGTAGSTTGTNGTSAASASGSGATASVGGATATGTGGGTTGSSGASTGSVGTVGGSTTQGGTVGSTSASGSATGTSASATTVSGSTNGGTVTSGGTAASATGNSTTAASTATTGATGSTATGATAGDGGSGSTGGTGGVTGSTAGATWHGAISARVTDAMLQTAYTAWKTSFVQTCSNGSMAVKKDAGSIVSEGIGYGMLLAVAMGDRATFDGLWKYYTDHYDKNGLMNWATGVCDAPGNNNANAATDGDLDVAMSLVQAAKKWTDGGYLALAETLAGKILQFEVDTCDGRKTLKPGDTWGSCTDTGGNQKVNPSYFAPGYYRVFASRFTSQAATWTALLDGSYQLLPIVQGRLMGLVPDWAKYDGSDWYGAGFGYDACRTPWRVAVDYAWSGDTRASTFLQGVSGWVDKNGGVAPANQPKNSAFVGAFALSGIYDQTKFDGYVTAWLGASGLDDTPYFQGTLRLLYLLVAGGKFPSGG